jgi:hypothetical protein
LEEENNKREENFRGMSREDSQLTFYKKYFLNPMFEECERKIAHNLDIILKNRLSNDLWDFTKFYDRILEQKEMLEGHYSICNPIEIISQKMSEYLRQNSTNYNNGLRIMEDLAGGSSEVNFYKLNTMETPRYRTPGHGREKIKRSDDDYISSYKQKQNLQKKKLGNLKEALRKSIKAEQLSVVLLFEQLESNFPLKEYKILLKAEKLAIIQRILRLMNRISRSSLVNNKDKMEKEDIQLENKMYYDSKDDDSDDDIGFGMGGMFSMMSRRKRKKNKTLTALKKRRQESVIDHSLLANLMDKLNSVGYDQLEFFNLIFQQNGLLRHKKTMEKVLKNMFKFIQIKNYNFNHMRAIFEIFENKINSVQEKMNMMKAKYDSINLKRKSYKTKTNKNRASILLNKYKDKFERLTSFQRIIVNHKSNLFANVFQTFYSKMFKNLEESSNQHVKKCLQNGDLTGKVTFVPILIY